MPSGCRPDARARAAAALAAAHASSYATAWALTAAGGSGDALAALEEGLVLATRDQVRERAEMIVKFADVQQHPSGVRVSDDEVRHG
jgi:hypothetical protein